MRIRRNIIQTLGEKGADCRSAAHDYSSSAAIVSGLIGHRVVGGPWWPEFALVALAMPAVVLRIVFPQDSPDKLAWWRDRRLTRRGSREASEPEQLHSEGPSATRP
jgi:hypothetical protein